MNTFPKYIINTLLLIFCLANGTVLSAQNNQSFNNYRNQIRNTQQQYRNRVFGNLRQYRDSVFKVLEYYRDSLNIPFGRSLQAPWTPINIEPPLFPPQYQSFYAKNKDNSEHFTVLSPFLSDKTFYGKKIKIRFPSTIPFHFNSLSEKEVGKAWIHLNECNLVSPICECLLTSLEMNLNDWGFYQLINYLANQLFPLHTENEKTMFCFFVLNQVGYRCKLARLSPKTLTILIPFNEEVYYKFHLTYEGMKYYIPYASPGTERLYTYEQEFKNTKRIADLHLPNPIRLGKDLTYKSFKLKNKGNEVKLPVNSYLIDFYNDYPRCSPKIYASAALAPELEEAIRKQFSLLQNMQNEIDKIDFLLKFIYQNFNYKPDREYWKEERYFFPEESLYYPYVDCEDLALLFRKLIQLTLGYEVLLVESEKHMYTAIKIHENISGDYILYQNEKYLVCDPSYFNSSPGMQMPECKGKNYHILPSP